MHTNVKAQRVPIETNSTRMVSGMVLDTTPTTTPANREAQEQKQKHKK
jgi:hypothetical protein